MRKEVNLKKRVLIVIGHPAQVHQFRFLTEVLEKHGHEVLFVLQQKEISKYLLDSFGMKYRMISRSRKGIFRKMIQMPGIYFRLFMIILSYRPTIILSRFTLQSSHLAWLMRIPHIAFTDTEHVRLMLRLTSPFIGVKITPHSFKSDLGRNHFRYNGNIELFYLHPDRFRPDPEIFQHLGIDKGTKYAVLRFVSWEAYHDINKRGLSVREKEDLVEFLTRKMKVFISSEGELPKSLVKYKIPSPPEKIHDVLAFSALHVGEGASMASEAAMLGVPTVYVNPLKVGYIEDAESAGLLFSLRNSNRLMERMEEMLKTPDLKEIHKKRCEEYLNDKIDVTGFVSWLVEEYPESVRELRINPDLTKDFRSGNRDAMRVKNQQ